MDDMHSAPQDPAPADAPDPAPVDPPPPPLDVAARVQAGITALRGGDRTAAAAIFHAAVDAAPRNEHAWIGVALASSTVEAAAAALQTAEEINPTSRFVEHAEEDLARHWPGFAGALAAARMAHPAPGALAGSRATAKLPAAELPAPAADALEPAVTPRLSGASALAPPRDSRARRGLLSAGVLLLGVAVVAVVGLALASSNLFSPPLSPATPQPPSATPPPPRAPPPPAPAAPVVHVPPALTAAPAASAPGARGPAASESPASGPGPLDIARQAAFDAVRAGRYAEAIPALEQTSERTPGDIETLYYLGLAYLGAPARPHGAEDAELTFRSILAARPHWAPGLDMLARSLIAQSRFADAVPPAYEAVQLDRQRAEYYITLGRAYQGGGDATDAEKAYGAAARLSPATPTLLALPAGATAVPSPSSAAAPH